MAAQSRISRLRLTDFRSYAAADLECDAHIVALVGENGSGKTNVVEAVSLLTAGRGLRRSDLASMTRFSAPGFAVTAEITGDIDDAMLATGTAAGEPGRRCRINRAPVSSANAFAEYLRLVWLTPEQDGLFRGSAGERRRFLDRLVLAIDPEHASRVSAMEKALRARNKLLEDAFFDARWLDATEHEIAEISVAVAAARRETVARLSHLIDQQRDDSSPFPYAQVHLDGTLENLLIDSPAGMVEDWHRNALRETRMRDRAAGRTLTGPQTSDLIVKHGPKDLEAARASTGEQKALLIGLILAHARLVKEMSAIAPIVLLDDVAAHLDPRRRAALIALLSDIGSQVWLTGADPAYLNDLPTDSCQFYVTPGQIEAMVQA